MYGSLCMEIIQTKALDNMRAEKRYDGVSAATVQNIIVKYLMQMIGISVQKKEKSL